MKGALCLLLVTTAACGITSDYGGTRFRCDEGRCPSGYQCIASFCEGGGGTGVDGSDGQGDAPNGTASCQGLDGLQDDFVGETLDLRRWQAYPDGTAPGSDTGSVFVSGGQLYVGGLRFAGDQTVGVLAVEPRMTTGTLSVVFGPSEAGSIDGVVPGSVRVGSREQEVRVDLYPFRVTVGGQPPEPGDQPVSVRRLEIAFSDDRRSVTVSVASFESPELKPVGTWDVDAEIVGANAEVRLEAGPGAGDPTAENTGALVIDAVGLEPGGRVSCPPEGG